ncbi:MAG: type II toxin-antitoxin system VapC family toxin [Blastocatellia bacterium]
MKVLLDTAPLVALLSEQDQYHAWAIAQVNAVKPPLLTCEAVLSEAHFLLRRYSGSPKPLTDLVFSGLVQLAFHLDEEMEAVALLMKHYANVPMSLADACLVRMSELYSDSVVLTTDSDFNIYRRHRRQVIPTLMPPSDQ